MKKFFAILFCLLAMTVMAQRPIQPRQVTTSNAQVTRTVDRSNIRVTGAQTKTYSYTISEMSIVNVSVMDYATTVQQQGKTDKVKVTISNCNVSICYYLYDANNQAINKNTLSSNGGLIDMSAYQPGEYRLQIIEQKGAERNFKIIKRQK